MTAAEIFKELIKVDGKPERQLLQYEALKIIFDNPMDAYLRGECRVFGESRDRWGTVILFPEDAPGAMPHITPETKVCPDITHWRDYCHAPDLVANCSNGWERTLELCDQARAEGKLATCLMGTGIFEQCHFLMGFEDTLTNLYEHPQEMHELIDYITDYRILYAKMVIEHMHPDAIVSHDDWGAKDSLFMKADMWREFFKEPYRRFYSYIKSQGVYIVHHADSYLVPIVEDMVELGIDVWQGVLPENDIPALQYQLQGRMTLMGGIGAAIDRKDATEEEIRAYVSKALKEYCPGGHFIPSITYGAPGTVYRHVDPIIDSEITIYNQTLHTPDYRPIKPVRRQVAERQTEETVTEELQESYKPILEQISATLQKGQKKKVLALCQEGIEAGIPAQTMITNGMVQGMVALGEAFAENRAFVPEMLMAARCMSAATEYLKPYLVDSDSSSIGKVCIGTVKGDMHDIGKNLVKIMMEGNGFEVVDLGVDVPAEKFIETAKAEKCDIICCSALLTTTMDEMRNVVKLADESGIRDDVIIMIGGAPITQNFCDEIGADAYTDDAATAARTAVKLVQSKKAG